MPSANSSRVARRSRRVPAPLPRLLAAVPQRSLVLLTLSYGALSYVQYMFFYWTEYYFEKVMKLPPHESRAAAFTITMSMARWHGAGWLGSDRLCHRLGYGPGCRTMALCGMSLSAGFSYLGIQMTDPDWVVVCFSLSFASLGLCEGIFWTMAPTLEKRNAGLACAPPEHRRQRHRVVGPHRHAAARQSLRLGHGRRRGVHHLRHRCLLWFGITPAPGKKHHARQSQRCGKALRRESVLSGLQPCILAPHSGSEIRLRVSRM